MADRAPLLLRPVHRWFFFWEYAVPSVYRIAAVAVAAGISTFAIALLTDAPSLVVAPIAVCAWIGIAVIQEHDERIVLPPDQNFLAMLERHVHPVLKQSGFDHLETSGPCRARSKRESCYLFQSSTHQQVIFVYRNAEHTRVYPVESQPMTIPSGDPEADAFFIARHLKS